MNTSQNMNDNEKSLRGKIRLRNVCIGVLLMAFAGACACIGYLYDSRDQICTPLPVPPEDARPGMRITLREGQQFINNFTGRDTVAGQKGWLINTSELRRFVDSSAYLHIALARRDPKSRATLVISGVTKGYNHWFPTGDVRGVVQQYVLDMSHPCPRCFDQMENVGTSTMRVNDLPMDTSDAMTR